MSDIATADVRCPQCAERFSITYWTSVNVTIDPELRGRVLDGSIRHHDCSHCGKAVLLENPLVYHDATCRFMVFFQPEQRERPITWNTKFLEDSARVLPEHQFRFVTSWPDLIERIKIFENGWDDTIIEMLKLVVTEKAYPFGSPEFSDCTVTLIGREEGPREPVLAFTLSLRNEHVGAITAPFEIYEGLAQGQKARSGTNVGAGQWKVVN